jgi:glycosyltransferase involved in cell wall biosynthesis
MARVSIILPTFNRLEFLRETIASVFAQSFQDFELVIADDGSDPPTREYLRSLESDVRVEVLLLARTGSPATARNAALRAARGEFVAFLDSDDLWERDKLRVQLAAVIERPDCQWSYCAFVRIDARGEALASERGRRWLPADGEIFEQVLLGTASIRTPCVLARRQLIVEAGGFDAAIAASEDYDLWLRLALRSPVALVNEPLVRVRIAAGGYSGLWPHVIFYQIRSIEKLLPTADARWRPLLRRQRARYGIALAREYRARGRAGATVRTLITSWPFAWRYPESWIGALRVLLGA